mmetsp:Transcript_13119/g.29853  ORF Transcript_13119/g.29853 Transcript_13119/m.29853 type:complete len:224 (+) Transcript_13119:82-753(+)
MGRRGKRSAKRSSKRAAVFCKTKMCPMLHTCTNGDECPFAHDAEELKAPPDLTRTRLCRRSLNGQVCENPRCRHAHSMAELRTLGSSSCAQASDEATSSSSGSSEPSDPRTSEEDKLFLDEEDGRLESVEEDEVADHARHEELPAIAAYGPDHIVVVENTFLNVRPTTPEPGSRRRSKSTPASLSAPRRAREKRAPSPGGISIATGSNTTSSEIDELGSEFPS